MNFKGIKDKDVRNAFMKMTGFEFRNSEFQAGRRDQITDVPGVTVGHYTMKTRNHHTGVTVILPVCEDGTESLYENKCVAASYVQNGFGKTAGLMQIDELGTLETPIALTNTLNVGKMSDALISHVLRYENKLHPKHKLFSINPIVGECNDSHLNDIAERILGEEALETAFRHAGETFLEGAVGAGTGTICYGLKGGIGSASRIVSIREEKYTFGLLVQSNFGRTRNLVVDGKRIGIDIAEKIQPVGKEENKRDFLSELDRGSIMMILATDMPLSARQLRRILKRVPNGLARTGSYTGNGSGEVVIGFTTANRISMENTRLTLHAYPDILLDPVFRAVSELSEEAVLNSMLAAEPVDALDGTVIHCLREFLQSER